MYSSKELLLQVNEAIAALPLEREPRGLYEPIRYVLMQRHLFSGRWIRPVTPEGQQAMQGWKPDRKLVCERE